MYILRPLLRSRGIVKNVLNSNPPTSYTHRPTTSTTTVSYVREILSDLPLPGFTQNPSNTMGKPIERVTMFKIPKEDDRVKALNQYKVLKKTAVKDGKPYILATEAGHVGPDPRSQGYTLAVKSTYASKEDMDYYDKDCDAHKALKAVISPLVAGPPLAVWFESVLDD